MGFSGKSTGVGCRFLPGSPRGVAPQITPATPAGGLFTRGMGSPRAALQPQTTSSEPQAACEIIAGMQESVMVADPGESPGSGHWPHDL